MIVSSRGHVRAPLNLQLLVILGSSCQCTSRKKGVRLLLEIFNPDYHEKQTIATQYVQNSEDSPGHLLVLP